MKKETKERIEYLLAPVVGYRLRGFAESIRRLADAVGRLEADPPRWYEVTGKDITSVFSSADDIRSVILVIGGRSVPSGVVWAEQRQSLERHGFTVRELEQP